jgi:hypothetical protein
LGKMGSPLSAVALGVFSRHQDKHPARHRLRRRRSPLVRS